MKKNYIKNSDEIPGLEYFKERALEISKKIDNEYIFCEIGTREGNSAIQLLDAIKESNKKRWLFTVDPYGTKPYRATTDMDARGRYFDYDEQCYRNGMMTLNTYTFNNDLLYSHWRMTSKDFMDKIESIEFWHDKKQIDYKFGLVFLDGEHYEDIVMKEFEWFKDKLIDDGLIIIDDIENIWQTSYVNKSDYLTFLGTIFEDGIWNENGGKLYYIKK
uniref:Putative methyltransferase n=1 Tax=viral metagenome TaxID=1070528 RepID=A0A6M3L5C9_9ZZZZ